MVHEPWFEHANVRRDLPEHPGFWPDADFDPAPVFAQVRVPVLLFYGEDDEWVPIDASIAVWRAALPPRYLTIVRLPGTLHHPTERGIEAEGLRVPEPSSMRGLRRD